jgi:hypothetical protein
MCVSSMIGDHYRDKWNDKHPWIAPGIQPYQPYQPFQPLVVPPQVSREEFDALRSDVLEMKELLKRAKKYDEDNHEPECEMAEKMALLRKVAEAVGINIDDVLSGAGRPQD